tara:strand:+ start:6778 stop:7854 length:1077 start_codon:yes stop_codon:yes gene_type:complete
MAKEYVRIGDTIGTWIDKNNNLVNLVGDPAELLTDSAGSDSSLVYSINELHKEIQADSARLDSAEARLDAVDSSFDSDIGIRTDLTTNDQTSLVHAINEVNKLATYFATFADSDLIIGKDSDGDTSFIVIADSSVTIEGNLRVRGNVFEQERFNDQFIVVQQGITADSADDAGLEVERGSLTNARIMFDEDPGKNYWAAGLQGAEKRILTDSDIGIQIASKDSVDLGQDSNRTEFINGLDSNRTEFISLGDSNKALIDSADTHFQSAVDSLSNDRLRIESNSTLGQYLQNINDGALSNRYVFGDSNADTFHFPGLQPADGSDVTSGANTSGILARKSTFLELRNSAGTVQKRIIGFAY